MSLNPIPDGAIVITAAEVYKELRDTHDEVSKLATMFTEWKQDAQRDIDDHETRLRALEKKIWAAAGVTTFVSAAVGVGAALLSAHP